jgi:hypothetical protein
MPARNNRRDVTIRNVTRIAVSRQRLGKHSPAEANERNNRRAVFSVGAASSLYNEDLWQLYRIEGVLRWQLADDGGVEFRNFKWVVVRRIERVSVAGRIIEKSQEMS